jgi:hypothetical protein
MRACSVSAGLLSAVVSLLPKQTTVETLSPLGDLTDEEIAMLDEMLAASRARLVRELEPHDGAAIALDPADAKQQEKRKADLLDASACAGLVVACH